MVPVTIGTVGIAVSCFGGYITQWYGGTNEIHRIMMASCRTLGDMIIITQVLDPPHPNPFHHDHLNSLLQCSLALCPSSIRM